MNFTNFFFVISEVGTFFPASRTTGFTMYWFLPMKQVGLYLLHCRRRFSKFGGFWIWHDYGYFYKIKLRRIRLTIYKKGYNERFWKFIFEFWIICISSSFRQFCWPHVYINFNLVSEGFISIFNGVLKINTYDNLAEKLRGFFISEYKMEGRSFARRRL